MSKKNGLKVFNRADYWKNVLNYNRNQVTCLLLEEITAEDLNFIKDNFWINFITYQKPGNEKPLNLFFKNGELKYSPIELKNINYALYMGKDKNIIYTGDTNTLNPFLPYIENEKIDELYVDVSRFGGAHLKIDDVVEKLAKINKSGTLVDLMHLDDKEYINAIWQSELLK